MRSEDLEEAMSPVVEGSAGTGEDGGEERMKSAC